MLSLEIRIISEDQLTLFPCPTMRMLESKYFIKFSVSYCTQENKIRELPIGIRTYAHPMSTFDVLPLRCKRLVIANPSLSFSFLLIQYYAQMVAKGVLIPFHRQIFEKLRCHGYLKQYFKCYQFEWKNFTSHLTSPFCKFICCMLILA